MNIRTSILSLIITLIAFALPENVTGQGVSVTGTITVVGKDTNGKQTEEGVQGAPVFYFSTKESAQDFKKKYKNLRDKTIDPADGARYVLTEVNGVFECEMISGSYILFYHPEDKNNPVMRGPVNESNKVFNEKFQTGGILITPVEVKAKKIAPPGIKQGRTRVFGDTISWTCNFYLPEGYSSENSRLIIQPYAVSCQDESDTVAYLRPIIMEGEKYHILQNKRKDYEYDPKDPLHEFYDSTFVLTKDSLRFTKVVTFKRPDAQKLYFCPAKILLEDYTHVLWNNFKDETVFGSCEVITPFKFLEFKLKSSGIPLERTEFYEPPSTKFRKIDKKLHLQFDKGKATLKADSINEHLIQQLAEELISYKTRLASVEITGTASPDGGYKGNYELARKRADAALRRVLSYVSGNHFQRNINEPKVYTWTDVADSLLAQGYEEESAKLREAATTYGEYDKHAYNVATNFSIFKDVVEPILEKQRVMICSYNYTNNSALTPEEAVHSWYNDPEYKEGGTQSFSNGDYFNLLTLIEDSTEQRKIVERAYKEITKQSGFHWFAFPAYIANRKAMYALEDGIIDTTILKPFIDFSSGCNIKKQISFNNTDRYVVNRPQLLVNQALFYLKAGKLGHSEFLINKLPESAEIKREISYYYDMINYVMHFDDPNLTDEERRKGGIGLDFVMRTSKVNRAVLKSELHKELGLDRLDVLQYIDSLPDSNSKKWYLKGMILSEYAGKEEEFIVKTQKEVINLYEALLQGLTPDNLTADNVHKYRLLTNEEDMNVPMDKSNDLYLLVDKFNELTQSDEKPKDKKTENDAPHFLAYFQKSFDMNPKYKEHYSHEGNISKIIFKKFPYKKEEADKYREKFDILVPDFGKEAQSVTTTENKESTDMPETALPTENNEPTEGEE